MVERERGKREEGEREVKGRERVDSQYGKYKLFCEIFVSVIHVVICALGCNVKCISYCEFIVSLKAMPL